ncbi:MAG: DUF1840 domain-containing protein [Burkholderiaceae bacterium]
MLVTFSSKNAADVLMLSHHAQPLLQAAGKDVGTSFPERGVFTPEQLDSAIAGIEAAVAQAEPVPDDDPDDDLPVPPMARAVGMAQRAFPLLELLRRARESGDNVMWESGRGY